MIGLESSDKVYIASKDAVGLPQTPRGKFGFLPFQLCVVSPDLHKALRSETLVVASRGWNKYAIGAKFADFVMERQGKRRSRWRKYFSRRRGLDYALQST